MHTIYIFGNCIVQYLAIILYYLRNIKNVVANRTIGIGPGALFTPKVLGPMSYVLGPMSYTKS